MVIALLIVLGVDLVALVIFLGLVLGRKRWVSRQQGAFQGAVRVTGGAVEGFRPKWSRGYGRWVRDVLVWTKAPFLFRNELVAIDSLIQQHSAADGEIRRLGHNPVVVILKAGTATIEIAVRDVDAHLARGPVSAAPNNR